MRWFVEVSRIGESRATEKYCVEAKQWQAALQEARKLRGDSGPLSKFSIELMDEGYRAVDPALKIRYVVNKAPGNTPLTDVSSVQPASVPPPGPQQPANVAGPPQAVAVAPGPPRPASVPPGPPRPASVAPPRPASVAPPRPASVAPPAAAPHPRGGNGAAVPVSAIPPTELMAGPPVASAPLQRSPIVVPVDEVPKAPPLPREARQAHGAPPAAAIQEVGVIRPTQPSLESVKEPDFTLVRKREEEPRPDAPIVYREYAYAVKPGTERRGAEVLLWMRFREVLAQIADRPKGKFIQLAVFDHVFEKRPLRPPIATLAWKDWRGDPVVQFPGDGAAQPSHPPAGSFPSAPQPAAPPAAQAAPAPQAQQPPPKPAATGPTAAPPKPQVSAVPRPVASVAPRPEPAVVVAPPASVEPAFAPPRKEPVVAAQAPAAAPPPKPAAAALEPAPPVAATEPPASDAPISRSVMIEVGPEIEVDVEDLKSERPAPHQEVAPEAPATANAVDVFAPVAPAPVEPAAPVASAAPVVPAAPVAPAAPPTAAAAAPAPIAVEPVAATAAPAPMAPAAPVDALAPSAEPAKSDPALSRRRKSGEDLIGELFELMHELHFMADVASGAEFVLRVMSHTLPCELSLIHVFDINTREFVVVRARGPGSDQVMLLRTPDRDELLVTAMRRVRALRVEDGAADGRYVGGRWETVAIAVKSALCGGVKQGGRYLGAIELVNPDGDAPFFESEVNALDYICEQFAEFLANRPIVLDAEVLLARR
jgi:hypothetical protein